MIWDVGLRGTADVVTVDAAFLDVEGRRAIFAAKDGWVVASRCVLYSLKKAYLLTRLGKSTNVISCFVKENNEKALAFTFAEK